MMRHLLPLVLLSAGAFAAPVDAQRLNIGLDRHGVQVSAELRLGGRGGPVLRIGDHCEPRVCRDHVRYEVRTVRVWVPGCERVEHVPARFGWRRDSCGRLERVMISPAYDRIVQEPGRWECREERVAVPCHCDGRHCGDYDDHDDDRRRHGRYRD